ncbi:hypothetical protein AK830_g181 [Neonectria ditissima]|uniref:Uncharacterized protein n=1 Tax=Neonectria ditissima TaxID=78410 RepID=A0A0P7BYP7_9HYPO|nr:hypothetical protein AK830_g181 [Neonectria ditissima]
MGDLLPSTSGHPPFNDWTSGTSRDAEQGNTSEYKPGPGNAIVAPHGLGNGHQNAVRDHGGEFTGGENDPVWLSVLAQAATRQAELGSGVGDRHLGAQEPTEVGGAFVQTGDPNVMLGYPGSETDTSMNFFLGDGGNYYLTNCL